MNGRRPREVTAAPAAVTFPAPIEKGIPIPPIGTRSNAGRKPFFPFRELEEVGDSFFINLDEWSDWRQKRGIARTTLKRLQASCHSASAQYKRGKGNKGKNFTTRRYTFPEEGVRVWRIA